ncbi:uncharacterized protein LOC121587788 [Anopheles merus]|uniref:uncharacterized protein LOC121587788 n=1 Tax=Anopheles merus TaxID=30066 RepID=UPI001BE4ABE3|nr:uncharacterized protein LOC121587788 [Anopheles merus]
MSRASELRELRNTFDRFSVWILLRHAASSAASVNLIHGKNVHPDLCNYMVALTRTENNGILELAILEHHLTKAQFEAVPEDARNETIDRMVHFSNVPSSQCSVQYYLHITNEWPTLQSVASPMILLRNRDLHSFDISSITTSDLCAISAARELSDARNRNVLDVGSCSGHTIRQVFQRILSKSDTMVSQADSPHTPAQFPIDARSVNGIKLEDLTALLNANERREGPPPLGLFLVRQANLEAIRLYVKKCCVDQLKDVTHSTWFLVSETIPFETNFPDHATVHEVAYVTDYGLVFWLRSRGPPTPVATHFTVSCWDEYDAVPPAPGWLNILVSNSSDGSTTYLEHLAASAKRTNPFQSIILLQAIDMMEVLLQPLLSWFDKLCQLIDAQQSEHTRHVVDTVSVILLVDHAIADDGSDLMAEAFVQFFNAINDSTIQRRVTVWIAGDDVLWTRFAANCKHSAMKYTMPKLNDDEQWQKWLSRMLPKDSKVDAKLALRNITANNGPLDGLPCFGTIFACTVLAEYITDRADDMVNGKLCCWWIDAMEHYVWKHIVPAGSNELQQLEEYCYERVFLPSTDHTKHFSSHSRIKHRTLQTLLAVQHLVKHPKLIKLAHFQRVGHDIIDLLLFRYSTVGIAVLHHHLDPVRQSSVEELRSITDCLQRNLLHVVHGSKEIADLLLSAEVPLEQQCVGQLNHWTPILAAIERKDWPLVDRLLAKGAKLSPRQAKLHPMPVSELEELVCDCIAENCTTLIVWVLENRPDYRITQQNVYTLSVYEEFDADLLFRLLTLAEEQGLTGRDPYRYIFDNSALDNAVEDERFELANFLVERLHFEATDAFNELRQQYEQNPQFNDYKRLHSLCRDGAFAMVRQMIEEKCLDAQQEYDGSNIFIQAASSGNLELVQYLCETHGFHARIDDRDEHGFTAMRQAMVQGHQPIVLFLRKHNATVNPSWMQQSSNVSAVDDSEIDTEDFLALIACDRERLARLSIDYNRYEGGELLLHCYIRYVDEPDDDIFRFLLAQYDNVDIRTDVSSELRCGETPLHLAYQSGNKRCREILLASGADIYAKSLRHGLTTLHFAVMGSAEKEIIEQLLDVYGFDVNTRDERGRTISFYMPVKSKLYHWLIERYQFDPCAADNNGQTVLHHRVIKNSFFARAEIEFLLQTLQVPQSHTDARGRLPLHYAVEADNCPIVRLLLKYRQDLCNVPDSKGLTVVQIAQHLPHDSATGNLFRLLHK